MEIITEHPHFFTATIYEWKPLLKTDSFKQTIVDSLHFLVEKKRVFIYGFVIMDNHIHLIWQMREGHLLKNVQRDFLKFTAQTMKFSLSDSKSKILQEFEVNLKDRKYQFWQRNPLSIELYSKAVFEQKLEYIHLNPVRAGVCTNPEDYRFSSARYYNLGQSEFSFLSDHEG